MCDASSLCLAVSLRPKRGGAGFLGRRFTLTFSFSPRTWHNIIGHRCGWHCSDHNIHVCACVRACMCVCVCVKGGGVYLNTTMVLDRASASIQECDWHTVMCEPAQANAWATQAEACNTQEHHLKQQVMIAHHTGPSSVSLLVCSCSLYMALTALGVSSQLIHTTAGNNSAIDELTCLLQAINLKYQLFASYRTR